MRLVKTVPIRYEKTTVYLTKILYTARFVLSANAIEQLLRAHKRKSPAKRGSLKQPVIISTIRCYELIDLSESVPPVLDPDCLRRRKPNPTSPSPNNARVAGSGTEVCMVKPVLPAPVC